MKILIAFSLGALFGAILMVVVAVILIDEKNQREGHGRLIDADRLKRKIMYAEDKAYETWDELYDSVLEEIDNAPTIIEADEEVAYAEQPTE